MNLKSFFAELKRRNVYKVAVAYAVVSWLLIQAASILFPTFDAPPWVMKVFVIVLVLGLVPALIFAWAFEITPEGIKRESEIAPDESMSQHTGRKIVALTMAVAVLAAGLFAFQVLRPKPERAPSAPLSSNPLPPAAAPEKSIAVLPFETRGQTFIDRAEAAERDNNLIVMMVSNAILARSYEKAIGVLKAQLAHPQALGMLLGPFENLLGDLQRHSGDTKAAMMTYQRAHTDLVAALLAQPDNPDLTNSLALTETWLGDKAAALADGQRAITLLPESKDAWVGPSGEDTLARIQAHFGDKESAIAALQHLLSISYGLPPVTPALFRLDPDWDNLRGDPRFEKLAAQPLTQTK